MNKFWIYLANIVKSNMVLKPKGDLKFRTDKSIEGSSILGYLVMIHIAKDLFDKSELNFNGGQSLAIKDANGKQSIKYYFADKSVVVAPTKMINMPDKYVTFSLKKDTFEKLMRGVTTLNLPDIAVVGDGKEIKLVATDKKTPSSNDYSLVIGETDKTFKAYFKTENFKMIRDDYDVAISSQKISHFINRNKPIQYWVAIEPDSEF